MPSCYNDKYTIFYRTGGTIGSDTKKPVSKFASLDIAGEDASDDDGEFEDDDDDEGQAFYAGGSRHSGQQVIGPPKKKNDAISKLFKAAKRSVTELTSIISRYIRQYK